MMRDDVLILGAAGFIGSRIRQRLADRYHLLSVDLQRIEPVERLVDVDAVGEKRFELDMGEPDDIDAMWDAISRDQHDVTAVIDLVAHYDFTNEPDERYDRVIVGLEHLLDTLPEQVPHDAPFIYASSMAALAPTEPGNALTPESPRLGAWAYPAHKIEAEHVIETHDVPQPRVELVLAGVYSDWCELVPLFNQIELLDEFGPEKYVYPGPTDRGLTYVHVDDVAEAFEAAMDVRADLERFLIGERAPVTYETIHSAASRAFRDRELPLFQMPKVLAKLGAALTGFLDDIRGQRSFIQPWMIEFAGEHFEFDLTHTRDELGWEPRRYMGDQLDEMCTRAAVHRDVWLERNRARPW
jgi:nucleoside-diphosphate-sugar epimerase